VGVLLAIEGIDGSGKGTQAAQLAESAAAGGYRVASFSFPLYDGNPFSRAVADYLNGEFGSADEVHPELAAMLYAGDRFHAILHCEFFFLQALLLDLFVLGELCFSRECLQPLLVIAVLVMQPAVFGVDVRQRLRHRV